MRTIEEVIEDLGIAGGVGLDMSPGDSLCLEAYGLLQGRVVICPRCKTIKAMEDEYPAEVVFTHLRVGNGSDAEYIKLTKTNALVIERLVVHSPVVQSYETIIYHVWEGGTYRSGYDGEPKAPTKLLNLIICRIRAKLKKLEKHNVYINTTWGFGFSIHSNSELSMVCRSET